MNNLQGRLDKIERAMDMNENLFPQKPNFEKWTNQELDSFIKKSLEENHKVFGIKNYEQAVNQLNYELRNGLLSENEFQIILSGEADYWEKREGLK